MTLRLWAYTKRHLVGILLHCMNERGSHKDRHEKLGQGCIGEDALVRIIRHPMLQDRPFILETPNEDGGYMREIAFVKAHQKQA